ncbi:MAG: hypothetical protein ACYTFT_09200 [Planctomycetota bacterium]|jgi:hypothetical protein
MSDTYAAFGRGLELGGKFTDRSTYTFELAEPGEAAAASASPVMVRGQATSGPTLRPNVVINRFNKSGRSLSGFVSEQKIKLAEALPIAKLEREGALEVAGGTGHELIFHLVGQRPVPSRPPRTGSTPTGPPSSNCSIPGSSRLSCVDWESRREGAILSLCP